MSRENKEENETGGGGGEGGAGGRRRGENLYNLCHGFSNKSVRN